MQGRVRTSQAPIEHEGTRPPCEEQPRGRKATPVLPVTLPLGTNEWGEPDVGARGLSQNQHPKRAVGQETRAGRGEPRGGCLGPP